MADPIQFRYALGYQEIREAFELANRSSLRQTRWGGILLILIGGIVAVIDWNNLSAVGFVMVLMGIYVLVRSVRDLRKWYDRENPQAHTYEASITDTGVTVKGSTSTGQYDWAYFTGYRNTASATILFHDKSYTVLPNSALSPDALSNLHSVIATHLKPLPDTIEKVTKLQVFFVVTVLALAIFFLADAVRNLLNAR